jgi:hypothetical protein
MLNTRNNEFYNANNVVNSNDLRKQIINVDSRFRSNQSDPTSNFTFNLERPYKNLIRLRVASVEIPNTSQTITTANNCFIVKAYDITGIVRTVTIKLPVGNYTSVTIMNKLQELLITEIRNPFGIYLTAELDTINGLVTFTHNGVSTYPVVGASPAPTASAKPFIIDFCECIPNDKRKENFNGFGTNLGFKKDFYRVTNLKQTTTTPILDTYSITSEGCLDVVGNTYMFLCVNDYHCVEQKTNTNYIQCLAKIIIREEKYMVIYDDGSSLLSNEIIFTKPTDLKILQVKLVDPYGDIIDLCGMNFSFSLEITEVLNTKLYDFYRNYIWLGSIPSVNYRTVQGSAEPLLKGIGPPW